MDVFSAYSESVIALGVLAVLMLVQLLIADVIGIKQKHIPGTSVPSDHKLLLFRATRTVANTNESIGIFLVAFVFAVLSGASTSWVGYSVWGFVIARAIYALMYYADRRMMRSIVFVFVLLSMLSLIAAGMAVWL